MASTPASPAGSNHVAEPAGTSAVSHRLHALQEALGSLPGVRLASSAYSTTLAAPLENARELALAQASRARDAAAAQVQRAEAALRARFGGYDTSRSKEHVRSRLLQRYADLFDLMDARGRGSVPIDELEDLFGAAGLYEARTEVGHLAYDADVDGNGALDLNEFTHVMDALAAYTRESVTLRGRDPRVEGSFVFGTEGASLTFKQVIFRTFDDPSFSELARILSIVIIAVIFLAVTIFVLESEPALDALTPLFQVAEGVCATIFTLEYAVRVGTCPSLRAFLLAPSNILDLLTIIPYFLDTIDEAFHPKGGFGGAMRILRIFRVFRIFRVTKYVPYVNVMASAARGAAAPLGMAVLVLGVGVLLLAFATFYAERGVWDANTRRWVNDAGDLSPYQDVGTSVYWTIITLSTVGYGDIAPVTGGGKAMGAITALAGCLILSFPVAIYTDEFALQYGEYEKKRALQAELGGADLIVTLTRTRARMLAARDWPRFAVQRSLKAHRASAAQPRNIAMMRWVMQEREAGMGGGDGVAMLSARNGASRHSTHSMHAQQALQAQQPLALPVLHEGTAVDEASAPVDDVGASFHSVWTSTTAGATAPRDAAGQQHDRVDATSPDLHAATVAAEQAVLMHRLLQRMAGGGTVDAAPVVERMPQQTNNAPAAGGAAPPRPRAAATTPQSTPSALPTSANLSDSQYQALVEQAREALRARRVAAATAAGVEASDQDPWAETALTARSFVMEDFASDADVEAAILELLSDVRKRMWAEIRSLEAKFRDDVAIELARRWSRWMALPPSHVVRLVSPYVFRRDELQAAMRFERTELPIGLVQQAPDSSTAGGGDSSFPLRRARGLDGPAAMLASVSASIMSDVRDVLAGHAPVHAAAGANALASQVRTHMPLALQPAPDIAHNYRARIANRYTDLLGDEVALELAPTMRRDDDTTTHTALPVRIRQHGAPRQQMLSMSPTPSRTRQLRKLFSAASLPAGSSASATAVGDADVSSSTAPERGPAPSDESEWVQTAFGLSQLPRNLQTISSSIGSGTASISGAGATVPRAPAPAAAVPPRGPMRTMSAMLSTLSAVAAAPLPMHARADEDDHMFGDTFLAEVASVDAPPASTPGHAGEGW